LVPGFFTLDEKRFGVIRIFDILMPVIGAMVPGDQVVLLIDAQSIRIDFEGQQRSGIFRGNRIPVGIDGNPELRGCPDLGDGGDVKGMFRQRVEIRPLLFQKIDGFLPGNTMDADIGDGVQLEATGGM